MERAKRRGASQHVEGRMPGAKAERAEPEPLELWCAGTAQLTSEGRAASKSSWCPGPARHANSATILRRRG
eukprot:COSAG02_NODE_1043_length_15014_cov_8.766007_13_plen_71_part_00